MALTMALILGMEWPYWSSAWYCYIYGRGHSDSDSDSEGFDSEGRAIKKLHRLFD